ncbi:hypothetical protein AB0N26_32270 [Streptomyces cellulosae]
MIEGLAKTVIEPLAARWRTTALGTSLTLWLAAVLLYLSAYPESGRCTSSRGLVCRIAESGPAGPALLLLAGVGAVVSTAFLASGVAPGLYTALTSNDWRVRSRPVRELGERAVQRHIRRRDRLSTAAAAEPGLRGDALDERLARRYPLADDWMKPTVCGNILASSSDRLHEHMGLDLTVVWQPLVAALPETSRTSLAAAGHVVLQRCQQILIALLGLGLTPLFPWRYAVLWALGCALAFLAFRHGLVRETEAFAEQVHAVVVTHRAVLYRAFGLPLPTRPDTEKASGEALTRTLRSFLEGRPPSSLNYDWPPVV